MKIEGSKLNREKKLIGVKEVFNLTPDDLEVLRKSIEKNNGNIRVFIHPWYSEFAGFGSYTLVAPKRGLENQSKFAIKGFFKVIFSENLKNVPVFIFEEERNMDVFVESLKNQVDIGDIKSNVIIIPTKPDESTPYLSNSVNKDEKPWDWSNKFLSNLGVRAILLGGMNLSITKRISERINKEYPMLEECVSDFYYHHLENFDIEFSSFTHPNNRLDVRKMYKDREDNFGE